MTNNKQENLQPTEGGSLEIEKDDLFHILDNVNMWIGNCDNKASTILATIGIVTSVIFSTDVFESLQVLIKADLSNGGWNCLLAVGALLSLISMLVGVFFLVLVITPSLIYTYIHKEHGRTVTSDFPSLMFYGQVAKQESVDKYHTDIIGADKNSVLKDLCFQIFSASKICTAKFQNLKKGLVIFFISFLLFVIFLLGCACI